MDIPTRSIEFDDKELKKLIEKKEVLVANGREISKQIEKLEKERNRDALKVQKIKEKVVPILKEKVQPQLEEFEDIFSIDLKEKGSETVVAVVFNQIDQYKQALRQRKEEQDKAEKDKSEDEKAE